MKNKKLYRVNLKGSLKNMDGALVVAHDPNEAYERVRKNLDDREYGFTSYRELRSIDLLAGSATITFEQLKLNTE